MMLVIAGRLGINMSIFHLSNEVIIAKLILVKSVIALYTANPFAIGNYLEFAG